MHSSLNRLPGWQPTPETRLICSRTTWVAGVSELRKRTLNKQRESGAFLLGNDKGAYKQIVEFVYYDDIDPCSLDSGIVRFAGNKLPKLWDICRERGYGIVADVHVHPGGYWQSPSDRADPVMPRAGHIGIIIPHFACRNTRPGGIGIYEYLGNTEWQDHTASGVSFFKIR